MVTSKWILYIKSYNDTLEESCWLQDLPMEFDYQIPSSNPASLIKVTYSFFHKIFYWFMNQILFWSKYFLDEIHKTQKMFFNLKCE